MLDTSNKIRGKHSNIKDFLVLRAQIPLKIDANDSPYFVPDPLFIYADLNEINVQVLDPFLQWVNYAPKKNDTTELLNLLVLEMLDNAPEQAASAAPESGGMMNRAMSFRSSSTRIGETTATNIETMSTSSVNVKHRPVLVKQRTESVHLKTQNK